MGKIFLNRLSLCTIIGTLEHERIYPQQLLLDVEIELDMSLSARSDDLRDALDAHFLPGKEDRTYDLERFVLRPLGSDGSAEPVPAFNYK